MRIAFILILFLTGLAGADLRLTSDSLGNLYKYWIEPIAPSSGESGNPKIVSKSRLLKYSKSIDQGLTFGIEQNLFTVSREVLSLDMAIGPNASINLVYETSSEVYYSSPQENGSSQTETKLLTKSGHHPVIAASDNLRMAAWEDNTSSTSGKPKSTIAIAMRDGTWDKPFYIQITGEALSSPSLVIDPFESYHLVFISKEKNTGRQRLYYSSESSVEPKVIFESFDDLSSPKILLSLRGIYIFWQTSYLNRKENYIIASQDFGKNFAPPIKLSQDQLAGIMLINNRWYGQNPGEEIDLAEIHFDPPPIPQLLAPTDKTITNLASPEIVYQFNQPSILSTRIEISWDNTFSPANTWVLDYINPKATNEVIYGLPVKLTDGNYFIRLSAFNGFSSSPPSMISAFRIDRSPPVITLYSPSAEAMEEGEILVAGKITEEARLSINDTAITPEAGGSFKVPLTLLPGKNLLLLIATDEAGNSYSINKVLTYGSLRPQLKVLKPKDSDWFKPGSTAYIEASAKDLQNDIEDESEADLTVSGLSLNDKLVYDKISGKISGFVILPSELPDGNLAAEIRLKDAAGNMGKYLFKLNLDRTPPQPTQPISQPVYSNQAAQFTLPVNDTGAGIDCSGTLISFTGASIESSVTLEAQKAVVKTRLPLTDGSYKFEVVPRDLVGNTGNSYNFKLVIDTAPPSLVIFTSGESEIETRNLIISGEAHDDLLGDLKIFNNQKLIKSFSAAINNFSSEIPLVPGKNEIVVEASDQAGNRTRQTLVKVANISALSTILTSAASGPNPFSPKNDGQMVFSFTLTSHADLRIYIFDIAGTLVWNKEYKNSASGNVFWDGTNHFGQLVESGLYPYLLQASMSGATEIKRGKLIVLRP